jgi:acetyltransferase-like isoleucine patch superfamily enzyme
MSKHKHSIKYSRIDLQITAFVLYTLFYFVPIASGIFAVKYFLLPDFLEPTFDWLTWALIPVKMFIIFYGMVLTHILLIGIIFRLVPPPSIGVKVATYSNDWLRWGIKTEIWKMTSDLPILYSIILKTYSLRWIYFKLIGLKLDPTSIIVTDVRIYDPYLLRVGKNCLLPVFSIFSCHIITGSTMYLKEIIIGDNVSIGARSGFAPGVEIGDNVTLGFSVLFGINVKVGNNTIIDSRASFADDVAIGSGVYIGKDCFVGRKAIIGDNLRIPDYVRLPAKAIVNSKQDLLKYMGKPIDKKIKGKAAGKISSRKKKTSPKRKKISPKKKKRVSKR